jgi:hypothetical protein
VEHDQVADLLTLGHVGPSGQHHERLGGLGVLRPRWRRQTEQEEDEDPDDNRSTHADHLQCCEPSSRRSAVNST